jgi:hypothetical protein
MNATSRSRRILETTIEKVLAAMEPMAALSVMIAGNGV